MSEPGNVNVIVYLHSYSVRIEGIQMLLFYYDITYQIFAISLLFAEIFKIWMALWDN